jgi:hypothetical protein
MLPMARRIPDAGAIERDFNANKPRPAEAGIERSLPPPCKGIILGTSDVSPYEGLADPGEN